MRALSIKQPWADLILYQGKDIENRSWRLPPHMVGQRIYVHAGKRADPDCSPPPERLGAILGEVTIVGCVTSHHSEWFVGPYGFVLADPKPYQEPIPCKGALGFFNPDIAR